MAEYKYDPDRVPAAFRDPSGWRPTELQQATPPEQRGPTWKKWIVKQSVCAPDVLAAWLAAHKK